MGSMMKNMTIGPKFILSISAVALLVIMLGLVVLYQQEEAKMDTMLSGRSSVISTQIMIGRAYITQNYVAKIKKSKAGADIQVLKDHTGSLRCHSFPRDRGPGNGRGSFPNRAVQCALGEPKSNESGQ